MIFCISLVLVHSPTCYGMLSAIINQCASCWRTLACSQEAPKWKDEGCWATEKAPAGFPQRRGGRILNAIGEEAGCFSMVLLMMCAERRNSLCPFAKASMGVSCVGWLEAGHGLDLFLGRDFHGICFQHCVHKESWKQKVCFSFPLWWKWVASGLNQ